MLGRASEQDCRGTYRHHEVHVGSLTATASVAEAETASERNPGCECANLSRLRLQQVPVLGDGVDTAARCPLSANFLQVGQRGRNVGQGGKLKWKIDVDVQTVDVKWSQVYIALDVMSISVIRVTKKSYYYYRL